MKLYVKDQMVLPVLESVRLGKIRNDAAAVLTASILTAPADTYFQKLSLALGDPARLLDDSGEELFLGSVHQIDRTEDRVRLTAYDRGAYLTRNELHGLFLGSGAEIAAQAAGKLGIPLGKVEADGQYKVIVSGRGGAPFPSSARRWGRGGRFPFKTRPSPSPPGAGPRSPWPRRRCCPSPAGRGSGRW